jgi:RND family efflux transporter MFP subunit
VNIIIRILLLGCLSVFPWLVHAADRVVNVSVTSYDEIAYFPKGSAPATVVSLNDATIAAQIESSVETIPVSVADIVSKGELLVSLDCRSKKAEYDSAKARYSLAQYQLQRARELKKNQHVSEEVLRIRQSEVEVARAAITLNEIDVERCRVTAPFNAVVAERIASVGEWVGRGQPLLRLIDLDQIEVSVQIADSIIEELEQVQAYRLVVRNHIYPVKLRAVSENVDKRSRTREVRFHFTGPKAHPGQTGRLVWKSARKLLPADYLVKRGQKYGVFIYREGRARFVVAPDAQEGRPFYINLANNVLVIKEGRFTVQDNDVIKVIR